MDGDLVEEIFKRGQELGLGMHIYTEDQVYGYQLTQEEIDFCAKAGPTSRLCQAGT